MGVDLNTVLLYERENENRPAVIAELEAALESTREPEDVYVEA